MGNESLFAASGSHDQDDHYAHVWYKPFENLQNQWTDFHGTWHEAFGTQAVIVCSNDDPVLTLTYLWQGQILALRLFKGKCENNGFFRNYCNL